jgi:hypothetical protein
MKREIVPLDLISSFPQKRLDLRSGSSAPY